MNFRDLLADFVGIAGLGLVSYGAWLVYQPAGFVVSGAAMVACAWFMGGAVQPEKEPE